MDEKSECNLGLSIEMQRCFAAKDSILEANHNDVKLLDDEEFDFDILPSPTKGTNQRPSVAPMSDDDEIFFGPMGFREQVAAKVVEEKEIRPLSPLTEKQQVELFVEAHRVAMLIREDAKKQNPPTRNSPRLRRHVPEVTVTVTPAEEEEKKPIGPFSLDFHSPVPEERHADGEDVPKKKVCRALLSSGNNSSCKENSTSKFHRSRSLRLPGGVRSSNSTCLPHPGSGLKLPMIQKRERTFSETSPSQMTASLDTSSTAVSPSKRLRLSIQTRQLQKPNSARSPDSQQQQVLAPRRSPRLSVVSSCVRLKSPKSPNKSRLQQMRKPSGLQAPKSAAPTGKPSMLKGPMSKLELVKPLQRKLQVPNRSKLTQLGSGIPSVGPLKASGPMKAPLDKSLNSNSRVSSPPPPPVSTVTQPLRPVQSHMTTPVKKERVLAPKNLMAFDDPLQLVTPKKCLFRGSSVSSAGSLESPALGIPSRPKMMHTPLLKDPMPAAAKKPPTGWTPVRRARPTAPEDEYILCTKRLRE